VAGIDKLMKRLISTKKPRVDDTENSQITQRAKDAKTTRFIVRKMCSNEKNIYYSVP
jgi:hypothetical protein